MLFADGATLRARVFDDGFALRWETAAPSGSACKTRVSRSSSPRSRRHVLPRRRGAHHGYEGLWRHEPISALGWATQTASLPLVFDLPRARSWRCCRRTSTTTPRCTSPTAEPAARALSPLPAPRHQRAAGRLPGLPWSDRARRRHRRDRGHAHLPLAGVRARPARRRPRRQRHGDAARAAARARASDFSWVSSRARWSGTTGPTGTSRASTSWPAATRRPSSYYVDFAAKHGCAYVNIDWLWTRPARPHGPEPRDRRPRDRALRAREERRRLRLVPGAHARGAARPGAWIASRSGASPGLKIDFFDRDDQRMIALYRRFADEAAKRKLIVLFHGATAPWGLSAHVPERARLRGGARARVRQVQRRRGRRRRTT